MALRHNSIRLPPEPWLKLPLLRLLADRLEPESLRGLAQVAVEAGDGVLVLLGGRQHAAIGELQARFGAQLSTAIGISPGAAIQPPRSRPRLLPTGGHRFSPLEPFRRSGVATAVGRSAAAASASSHGQLSGTTPLPSVAWESRKLSELSVTITWAWWSRRSTVAAAAMIDRLVHHAEILGLKGDSYRLRDKDLGFPPPRD